MSRRLLHIVTFPNLEPGPRVQTNDAKGVFFAVGVEFRAPIIESGSPNKDNNT